jgi:hypothetical protein
MLLKLTALLQSISTAQLKAIKHQHVQQSYQHSSNIIKHKDKANDRQHKEKHEREGQRQFHQHSTVPLLTVIKANDKAIPR